MENILYKSTRGNDEKVTASKAILKGIAGDGGLFVPEKLPKLKLELKDIINKDYKELAYLVMKEFLTDFTEEELKYCIDGAYDKKFDTSLIAPLKKAGDDYYLELYHGATLAFKDMALSILPYLLKTAAKKEKMEKEIVILTATSGDTGKAALEGFSDVEGIKIIVFFPEEGVSDIQKRQMTTHKGNNTYVVGIKGNFDHAQSGVKNIFNDKELAIEMDNNNYIFSSANSINIGRLVPQVVYYFYAYSQLCKQNAISVGEKMNVVVPTGNFGNILAGYYAASMGLPINKFICASNDNNVLTDFINSGVYDRNREFFTTVSPSMDILISSNLERMLYELSGGDSNKIREFMADLNEKGIYEITKDMKDRLGKFYGAFANEEETLNAIKEVYARAQYLIDTHTSVAYVANEKYKEFSGDNTKSVIVSTASPYKFTGAVMGAIDDKYNTLNDFELIQEMAQYTEGYVPAAIKDIEKRTVIHSTICEKDEMKQVVKGILNI